MQKIYGRKKNRIMNLCRVTKLSSILTIAFLVLTVSGCGTNRDQLLNQANQAYDSGDKETAKALYTKAAQKGDPSAHFALAYKYSTTPEESIYHYSEAAKKGHEKALDYALDALLFRANSLERANPQKALEIYKQAKKENPNLKLYDEEVKLKTIQMSMEPGPFDWRAFCAKYNVLPHNDEVMYHVWLIAEEASKDGRFGKPDPKLILQLVSRGGWAPAELEYAVEDAYKNWKSGVVKEFNICEFITSGGGMAFCASRADTDDNNERENALKELGARVGVANQKLLTDAYESAVKFIELKASKEEGHGGSGYTAWVIGSEMEQKNEYLTMLRNILDGFKPSPKKTFDEADAQLNKTYKRVMNRLKKQVDRAYDSPSFEEVRDVQRLWLPYRDASVRLFLQMNPSVSVDVWKSWLTETREAQLMAVID